MSHDGTFHSDYTAPDQTARQIVELYHRNVVRTATTFDVWTVGNALVRREDGLEERIEVLESDVDTIEEEIEILPTIEEQMNEVQEVVAQMIFELNELGIDFTDKIEEFKDKYLNT